MKTLIIKNIIITRAYGCQRSVAGCLTENKKSKSKKGHNSEKNHFELSPMIVWNALWVVNTYSEGQVNTFRSNRDITKFHGFLHDDSDDAKAIAIPQVSPENSQVKNRN